MPLDAARLEQLIVEVLELDPAFVEPDTMRAAPVLGGAVVTWSGSAFFPSELWDRLAHLALLDDDAPASG